jgi:protein disulfide-isomerase A1
VIVAKSYQDLVIDNDKDVLLEFYAPWCGHCKALAPKYDELAEKFAAFSDKVTIAKIDATTNDVPDDISGFPTIKLFKAGAKDEPIEYSGARSVEALAEFVRDNGSHKVAAAEDATAESVETDGMPQQAAAASGVKEKIAEAAEVVKDALLSEDEPVDSHDEL